MGISGLETLQDRDVEVTLMCVVPVTNSLPMYHVKLIDIDYLIDWLLALG